MSEKLRAGIIGLGVGRAHARGYAASPDAELVAFCDANPERLNEMADEFNVPERYTDYQTMLKEAKLDMVSVCLPNTLHPEASIAALEAGVNVICEKPMASNVEQARQMVEVAGRNGRQLMMAYNYRYRADTAWLYRMIHAGRLGKVIHIHASWRRETGIPGWGWFGSQAMSGGGALIDLGVHVLDMVLWMLDFPAVRTVSGDIGTSFGQKGLKTWKRGPQHPESFDVEDGGIGFLRLANGANMVLQATWAEHNHPEEDRIRVEIQGTEGTAMLNIANYTKTDTLRFYTEIEGEPMTVIPSVRWGALAGHEAMVVDLAAHVRAGQPAPSNGEQGLASVTILEALYNSARTGHEVTLE